MTDRALIGIRFLAASAFVSALLVTAAVSDEAGLLESPYGGQVRALIIGIDAYQHVRPLKGAVADARDIEESLRRTGVTDVTALIDDEADRASVLSAINHLVDRTGPKDLIIFSLAGHGAQEPERVKGSQPDGLENVFLLAGFENSAAGSLQRILGAEFNHFIKQFESRGAHVLFVADTCYGGGMTRDVDPRSDEMSFRQVPGYKLSADLLQPVTTSSDEFMTELDFDRTAFLAAVDRKTKAPEVEIPGIDGLRGALSYSLARVIEGDTNTRGDGKTTLKELFENVRQRVYLLSNGRQSIVTTASPTEDLNTEVVFKMVRSVSLGGATVASNLGASVEPSLVPEDRPIKIASLDGRAMRFAGLSTQRATFKVVSPTDYPDLIWDPTSHDVIAWGDVISYRVATADLPSVIDRAMAIRELKRIAGNAPQAINVAPDDGLHRSGSEVQINIPDIAGRALFLFNIAGDGTVQVLYPIKTDPYIVQATNFSFPVSVREPFGSDQLVAITSKQRMPELEQALQGLDNRRSAFQLIDMIRRYATDDIHIGSAGLFTAP